VEVEPGAEPEVVLEAVPHRVPARPVVDELDPALDDLGSCLVEQPVDAPEKLRMHLVLGVEHTDDVTRAARERAVQRARLVLRPPVVDDDPDTTGVSTDGRAGCLRSLGIVLADHDEHLVARMVERGEPFEGRPEHRCLVAGGDDERERGGAPAAKREGGARELVRRAPRVEHPDERRRGDRGQRQRQERVDDVEVSDRDPLRACGVSPTDSR
jgi:hypothetical protein